MKARRTITIVVAAVVVLAFAPVVFGGQGKNTSQPATSLQNTPATTAAAPTAARSLHQHDPTAQAVEALVSSGASLQIAEHVAELPPESPGRSSSSSGTGGSNGGGAAPGPKWPKEYLEETRAEVIDNGAAAEAAVAAMCEAALGGDDPPVAGRLPDVPGSVRVAAATPRTGWANVFNADGTTVYFFYADVVLEERGIASARTFEIPMTHGASGWKLSNLGIQTPGLQYVQSVEF